MWSEIIARKGERKRRKKSERKKRKKRGVFNSGVSSGAR